MNINPSPAVRAGIYVVTALGTPVVAYLQHKGILDDAAVALWSAEVAVAGGLAALNTGAKRITRRP